jgi:hypothetical protein
MYPYGQLPQHQQGHGLPQQQQHQEQQQQQHQIIQQQQPTPNMTPVQSMASWSVSPQQHHSFPSVQNEQILRQDVSRPPMPSSDSAPDISFVQQPVMTARPFPAFKIQAPSLPNDAIQDSILDTSKYAPLNRSNPHSDRKS